MGGREVSEIVPTEEQQAIIEAASGPEPLMCQAYAGTAKTSTLVMAAQKIRAPALALAFNRRISEELKTARLPANWRVMTLNGLGYLAWVRSLPGQISCQIDDRKVVKLVRQAAKESRTELASDQYDGLRRLVGLAQQAGLVPDSIAGASPLVEDLPESWDSLCDDAWVPVQDRDALVALARRILEDDIALARQGIISFDDQIYCPTVLGGAWPRWPAIAGDEVQDWSPINLAMVRQASRPNTKWLLVGDSRQSIYSWRGADSEAMLRAESLSTDWQSLPLTVTFRCPRRIVARQQKHAPGFKSWHGVVDGHFAQTAPLSDSLDGAEPGGWTWPSFCTFLPEARSRAVLCRNNAPLLRLAFALIRQRVAPTFAGRDIGKGLASLSRQIAREDSTSADRVRGAIDEWELSEASRAESEGKDGRLDSISDRAESLRAVLDGSQARTAGELREALAELFRRDGADVVLSTIHRAKGLEWDLVLHLDPWRVGRARRGKVLSPEEARQEANLKYVCETRTRHTLVEASLEDFRPT